MESISTKCTKFVQYRQNETDIICKNHVNIPCLK